MVSPQKDRFGTGKSVSRNRSVLLLAAGAVEETSIAGPEGKAVFLLAVQGKVDFHRTVRDPVAFHRTAPGQAAFRKTGRAKADFHRIVPGKEVPAPSGLLTENLAQDPVDSAMATSLFSATVKVPDSKSNDQTIFNDQSSIKNGLFGYLNLMFGICLVLVSW
ncbi:MAG: hypothetical protein WC133_02640 [Candidatus Omnitrophota bacterium]